MNTITATAITSNSKCQIHYNRLQTVCIHAVMHQMQLNNAEEANEKDRKSSTFKQEGC